MKRPENIPFEDYKTSPCYEDRRLIKYIEQLEAKVKTLELKRPEIICVK